MASATRTRLRRLEALKHAPAPSGLLSVGAGVSGILAALSKLARGQRVEPDASTGIGRMLIEARRAAQSRAAGAAN